MRLEPTYGGAKIWASADAVICPVVVLKQRKPHREYWARKQVKSPAKKAAVICKVLNPVFRGKGSDDGISASCSVLSTASTSRSCFGSIFGAEQGRWQELGYYYTHHYVMSGQ